MNQFKSGPVYLDLVRQADAKTLRVAPDLDLDRKHAFLNGYETALSDIANGWIKVDPDALVGRARL